MVSSAPIVAEKPSISPAKLRTNRLNAQKSTGPRTKAGKIRSCQNAIVHGLRSADILATGEDPRELAEYRISIIRSTNPRNALELEYVDQIIRAGWKLRRYQAAEIAVFQDDIERRKALSNPNPITTGMVLCNLLFGSTPYFNGLTRYEQQYTRMMNRAVAELRRLQKDPIHGCLGDLAGELIKEELQNLMEKTDPTDEPDDQPENAPNKPTANDRDVTADGATSLASRARATLSELEGMRTHHKQPDDPEGPIGTLNEDPPDGSSS